MRSLIAFISIVPFVACSAAEQETDPDGNNPTNQTGGSAGSTVTGGTGGAATGGAATGGASTGGASTGGSAGTIGSAGTVGSGGTSGSGGGTSGTACGAGKAAPAGATIDNFDGMSAVLEWRQADTTNTSGTIIAPAGTLVINPTGMENVAVGALAAWAAASRPCMDGSAYTGIQFDVSGDVEQLAVRLGTPATYPVADGGVCAEATACGYAHYQTVITDKLGMTGVQIPFSGFTAPWGTPAAFDKSALISIIFLTLDTNAAHSFTVDNITFY